MIIDCASSIEEFLNQVIPLKMDIVLYRFGTYGRLVKATLNGMYHIQERMIVDDALAMSCPDIHTLEELSKINLNHIVVLVTGSQEECQSDRLKELFSVIPEERCFILLREEFKRVQKQQNMRQLKTLELLKKVESKKLEENAMIYHPEATNSVFFLPYVYMDYIQQTIFLTENYYEIVLLKKVFFDFQGGRIKEHIKDGCVLDIGANIGNHTLYFANELGVKKIHSFEPIYETYRILTKNVSLNHLDGVVSTHCIGLSNKDGMGCIEKYDYENIGSTCVLNGEGNLHLCTLDEVGISENICFIKIDAEGMEVQILQGAIKTLRRDHPYIMLESWKYNFSEVNQILLEEGYEYEQLNDNYYLFYPIPSKQPDAEIVNERIWRYQKEYWVRFQYLDPYNGMTRKQIVSSADDILHGKLWLSKDLGGYLYSPDAMDWNMSFSAETSKNTCKLYLNGLSFLGLLSMAYSFTKKTEYLACAQRLFYSWDRYIHTDMIQENITFWADYPVSLRVYSLLNFALFIEGSKLDTNEFRRKIYEILIEHAKFLYDDRNYNHNHNYGIMQDCSLLLSGIFLNHENSEKWISHAMERMDGQWKYSFTEEMVHVENSIGYAVGVSLIILNIRRLLSQFRNLRGMTNEISSKLYQIGEFFAWITLPNGMCPMVGDSYRASMRNVSREFKNARLNFAISFGEYDMMLWEEKARISKCYPASGYWFYREMWEKGTASTWKMMKAGYISSTHKHADDLSFMMYSKGCEIFIDPGMYNYMMGTAFRDYFISSSAHNTVTVDEKSYSTTAENSAKTGILSHDCTDKLDHVLAFNDMYDGVEIDRHLYSSGDLTILYDDIVSKDSHSYSQLFHLSEQVSIVSSSSDEVLIRIKDTGYHVRIRQIMPVQTTIFHGRKDELPLYGYRSEKLNSIEEINTICYQIEKDNAQYLTIVSIEDSEGMIRLKNGNKLHVSEIVFHEEKNEIQYGGDRIQLASRKRFYPKGSAFIADQNTLLVKAEHQENCLYALYLISMKTGKSIYRTGYSENNLFLYDLTDQNENLIVRLYVRNSRIPLRKHAVIAALTCNEKGNYRVDDGSGYPHMNFHYTGHHYEKIKENKYGFFVDFSYSFPVNIKWYVYKNGAYYSSKQTVENKMEIEFTEPGDYTICYYIRSVNSDNMFWNFPSISVKDGFCACEGEESYGEDKGERNL